MMRATSSFARALAFSLALVATSAIAEDTGVPPVPGALPPGHSSPYLLAGPRYLEANASIATLLDSNPRLDAAKDARTGRSSFVTGMDIGIPFVNQRIRPSIFAGIQLGYWGDDAHGPVTAYPGLRFRGSFYMDDVFDMYALVRADFPITGVNGSAAAAFRPGLGIGLRVARAVSLEGSYDVLVPIGPQFTPTQYASFVPIGMTISLMIDTCFTCTYSDTKPKSRNMACRLYNLAKEVSTPQVHDAICAAIPKAMIACPDPLAAKRDEDGASTFLATLQDSESGDAKAAVKRLVDLHAALLQQWSHYEEEAARQAANKRALAERWSYAPVPAELRNYFGCDSGPPPPPCTEVTTE